MAASVIQHEQTQKWIQLSHFYRYWAIIWCGCSWESSLTILQAATDLTCHLQVLNKNDPSLQLSQKTWQVICISTRNARHLFITVGKIVFVHTLSTERLFKRFKLSFQATYYFQQNFFKNVPLSISILGNDLENFKLFTVGAAFSVWSS